MLHLFTDYLSIWEIAHRWYGHDPNQHDGSNVPLNTQDLLRLFTKMIWLHELRVTTIHGIDVKCEKYYIPDFDDYVVDWPNADAESEGMSPEEKWQHYADFKQRICGPHDELVKNFPDCYVRRIYNRDELDRVCLKPEEVKDFCRIHSQALPSFLFTAEDCIAFDKALTRESFLRLPKTTVEEFVDEAIAKMAVEHPGVSYLAKPKKKDGDYDDEDQLVPTIPPFPTKGLQRLFDAARAAYTKYWSLYDPSDRTTSPDSSLVETYLMDEWALSARAAKVIQTAIREPATKAGGTKQ